MSNENIRPYSLEDVIARMVRRAEAEPFKPVYKKLKRGLEVTITFERRTFNLEIKREDTNPSTREWETILNCWPYPTFGQCLADQLHKNILHGQVGIDKRIKLL